MGNLIAAQKGLKSVVRYTFAGSGLTNNTNWSGSVTITAVSDTAKTSINLLSSGSRYASGGGAGSPQGSIAVRLASTTSVEYIYDSGGTTDIDLAFEVIEYY